MYQIPDILYQEKMPPRAKKLFAETFSKYHKLNGGDEDIAIHKARKALEEKYVKVDTLHNSWIPRKAAYEIVKDDIYDSDDKSNTSTPNISKNLSTNVYRTADNDESNNEYTSTEYETDVDDNEKIQRGKHFAQRRARKQKFESKKYPLGKLSSRKRLKQNTAHYETSEDEDSNYYNY